MSAGAHRELLGRLVVGESLGRTETEELFGRLMDGELGPATKAALLVLLAAKGETADEIAGAAAAMRERVVRIPHSIPDVIDTCGTGGDGAQTFNISTAAALVAAAAGAKVAKHGNRSVSSRSGSADLLAALGVDIETDADRAGRTLADVGIAFLFAPRLHPAMAEVMPVRRELGIRTIFNLLGPLTNPAGARRQVLGIYDGGRVGAIARVLRDLGADHAMVVHGSDGLDEITTTGPTSIAEVRGREIREWTLDPEELGVARVSPEALRGGDPQDNARVLEDLFAGGGGPLEDIVALNAGAALVVAGRAEDLRDGLARAREAIRTGKAADTLDRLRRAGAPGDGEASERP